MPTGAALPRMHRPADELDGLLRAYFRAELPHPWPAAPGTASSRRGVTPAWQRWHRHLALAAAVSFFLAGSFLLTRGFPEVKPGAAPTLSPGKEIGKQLERPASIDREKTREQLPAHQADPPLLKILSLDETPSKSGRPIGSYGVETKGGVQVIITKQLP